MRPSLRALKKKVKNRQSDISPTAGTKITAGGNTHTLQSFAASSRVARNKIASLSISTSTNKVTITMSGTGAAERTAQAHAVQKEFRKRLAGWRRTTSLDPTFQLRVGDAAINTSGNLEWDISSSNATAWFTAINASGATQFMEIT